MSDLVKLFFLCNQGLGTLLLVPHKAILGIMASGCIFPPQSWVRNFILVKLELLYYHLVKKSAVAHGVPGQSENAVTYKDDRPCRDIQFFAKILS